MRELLAICTTENPFSFLDHTYKQIDGVSMGSPRGPTFADFYMSHLECFLLQQNKASNPRYYKRYVDDTIVIFKNSNHLNWFKIRFARNSVLNFTHEEMGNGSFHFLDVMMTLTNAGTFSTSVYTKPTDNGSYTNSNSNIPLTYKKSIIKTLFHRAIKYCL